jgi:hypothetical protein
VLPGGRWGRPGAADAAAPIPSTDEGVVVKLLSLFVTVALLLPAAPASAAVPRLRHVFLIVGENTSVSQVTVRHAPYLTRTLRPRGAWLTNYHTFTRSSSLGQYIAMVSGQFTRCEANNALPARCHQAAPNLLSQLDASGRTWRDWQESMPAPCFRHDAGRPALHNEYSAHHNPALYFTGLRPACPVDNLPMGGRGAKATDTFDAALAAGAVGTFNLVVPNDCENGHDPCGGDRVRHFDAFLAREVPRIRGVAGLRGRQRDHHHVGRRRRPAEEPRPRRRAAARPVGARGRHGPRPSRPLRARANPGRRVRRPRARPREARQGDHRGLALSVRSGPRLPRRRPADR